jgi:hypothetical protein
MNDGILTDYSDTWLGITAKYQAISDIHDRLVDRANNLTNVISKIDAHPRARHELYRVYRAMNSRSLSYSGFFCKNPLELLDYYDNLIVGDMDGVANELHAACECYRQAECESWDILVEYILPPM